MGTVKTHKCAARDTSPETSTRYRTSWHWEPSARERSDRVVSSARRHPAPSHRLRRTPARSCACAGHRRSSTTASRSRHRDRCARRLPRAVRCSAPWCRASASGGPNGPVRAAWHTGLRLPAFTASATDLNLETFNAINPAGGYFGENGVIGPANLINVRGVVGFTLAPGGRHPTH